MDAAWLLAPVGPASDPPVPVTAIGRPVLRILAGHPVLRVHSVFESAVNLSADDRLVVCTAGPLRAPHGVELAPTDLARLRDWSTAGRRFRPLRGQQLPGPAETAAHAGGTLVFDPAVPRVRPGDARHGAALLQTWLSSARPPTGFGDGWPQLQADPGIVQAARSLLTGTVDDAVVSLMGRGPGLTPSGDDVLAGICAAGWSIGALPAARAAGMPEALERAARSRTTDIAVEYLYYASRGMAIGTLRDLLAALAASPGPRTADAVTRLLRHGHTSGADCLLGVLVALQVADTTPD